MHDGRSSAGGGVGCRAAVLLFGGWAKKNY